jgi:hypothetical protein
MTEISLHTDDYIPRMLDSGMLVSLETFCAAPKSTIDVENFFQSHGYALNWDQIKQFLVDVIRKGEQSILQLDGDVLPTPIIRDTVSGLGCNSSIIWFTPPSPLVGTWRFYVNGVLKQVLVDYNTSDFVTLEAVPGDTIQVCKVTDGVVGWWAQVVVPEA